ncbi:uncharacterized protein LOC112345275 isoform X1 [Selaginella moellendorffii]|uniref:uncharacterized protein LOC112345275 isoform X1 n=1 Tax=Selaginella moellendorffii TaxID=88036 RepID=UPI000D1CFB04|nr:uncharacterized protein LOC112345275 isoform X1 [Selaginella moellendorffii]|eukprot:XP_024527402.1 uncharacterized protein LOC112345275 isoform X1 [Selaginella moellendorffii]
MQGAIIALPTTPRYKERSGAAAPQRWRDDLDACAPRMDQHRRRPDSSAPHYISPVLLRLIASNAPMELDVFSDLVRRSKVRGLHGYRVRERQCLRKPQRPAKDPVEELLETIREYNKISEDLDGGAENPGKDQSSLDRRRERDKHENATCSSSDRISREGQSSRDFEKCRERGWNRSAGGSRNAKRNSKQWSGRSSKENSCGGRSCSRECVERYSREKDCFERPRSKSRHQERPFSAREGRCAKESSLLAKRPWSARDESPARKARSKSELDDMDGSVDDGSKSSSRDGPAFESPPKRGKSKQQSWQGTPCDFGHSFHDEELIKAGSKHRAVACDQDEKNLHKEDVHPARPSLQEIRFRPASAGPVLTSERAKPLWFRQASVKALLALERNLYTKLNIADTKGLSSNFDETEQVSLHLQSSKSRIKDEEFTSGCLKSTSSKHSVSSSHARPVTAPVVVNTTSEIAAAAEKVFPDNTSNAQSNQLHTFSPRKSVVENATGLQGVQHPCVDSAVCSTDVDFPITRKFVEDKRCFTAPSSLDTPRKSGGSPKKLPAAKDVDEDLAASDDEEENDVFKDYVQNGMPDNNGAAEDAPSTCSSDYEDVDIEEVLQENAKPVEQEDNQNRACFLKLKKKGVNIAEDVTDLFKGVHESLLVSSKLAEVVDLCSKRGQELLRARESMVSTEKAPERSRWPFRLHRTRQSRANRRALRAELKWSIFSNGGKLRALNPIYGGKKFIPQRIRFVSGDDHHAETPKQSKRPATAPADVQRAPSREDTVHGKHPNVSSNGVRRAESIGPWTPTPEANNTRFHQFDAAKHQKKRLPLETQKDFQQLQISEAVTAFICAAKQKFS